MKKITLIIFSAFLIQTAFAQSVPVWTNISSGIVVNPNSSLTRSLAGTTFDAGANSYNVLQSMEDGWLEFTFQSGTANNYAVGVSKQLSTVHTLAYLDYSFVYEAGALSIRESGTSRKSVSVVSGNILRIWKQAGQVKYYKNGVLEHSSTVTPSENYIINASVKSGTSPALSASFKSPLVLIKNILPLNGTEEGRGEVHLSGKGGTPPYTFSWRDGFIGADQAEMLPGIYSVSIKDDQNTQIDSWFPVGYKMFWVNPSTNNIAINADNSLVKTYTGSSGFDAGYSSDNKLAVRRDGWIGFVCEAFNVNNRYAVGMARPNAFYDLANITYALVYYDGYLRVYKSGMKLYDDPVNDLKEGDYIRMERRNGQISCFRNESVVFTFTEPSEEELFVDASLGRGKTPVIMSSFARLGSKVPPEYRPADNFEKNWSFTTVYDESGKVIGQEKQFYDFLGRPTQGQAKDLTSGNIFADQTIYDAYGRAIINTMSAPIENSGFSYKDKFIKDNTNAEYSYLNVDDAKINNPDPLSGIDIGTLGWYYSVNNNLEPATPITSYPYSRIMFNESYSTIKRSSGAGDIFRMGNGHERKNYSMPVINELDHYLSIRSHFLTAPSSSLAFQAFKSITVDENGKESIIFSDKSGNKLASCLTSPDYEPLSITAPLEEFPTCFYFLKRTRNTSENGDVLATTNYIEVYDVADSYNLIFRGNPGPNFKDILPFDRELEFRSDERFSIIFFTSLISFRFSHGTEISPFDIILRKNFVDLHISASASQSVNITGAGNPIKVFDQLSDQLVYEGAASGLTSLAPGFYKVATQPGTGSYQISYNVYYGDFSYNYYDDSGKIIATVSPNGVNTQSMAYPSFVNKNQYSATGLILNTSSADEGSIDYVYRQDGLLRFSQNAQQRTDKKFSYTNYDRLQRPIESGIYQMAATEEGLLFETQLSPSGSSRSVLQASILENITDTGGLDGARCFERARIWYDLPFEDPDLGGRKQDFLNGNVSKTQNDISTTWYSYDDKGRITWTVQKTAALGAKSVEYTYDFAGNVTQVAYQKGLVDAFYHHYNYDASNNLKELFTSLDGINKTLQATHSYYLHGPLKRIVLGSNLQGVDYVYTIDGAIKSINHADNTKDPGSDGNDIFGLTLQYHNNDYQGAGYSTGDITLDNSDQFNGLLKASLWHGHANLEGISAYSYSYDKKNYMARADFGSIAAAAPYSFTINPLGAYKEEVTNYDNNGNIKELKRKGKQGNQLSDYTYHYDANNTTNKLDKITQGGADYIDYTYNSIGQMTQQTGDGKSLKITYTGYGLMSEVRNGTDQLLCQYKYDDRGNMIQRVNYTNGNASSNTFYLYDAGGNVLSIYFQTLPGGVIERIEVPIYGLGRIAIYKPGVSTYFYEVNDHLGNVRGVIGKPETENPKTNFESATNTDFGNYHSVDYDLYDHTDAAKAFKFVHQLHGGYSRQIGMTRSFDVSPGDVIKTEVWAKYEGNIGPAGSLPSFASALLTAFGAAAPLPGETGTLSSGLKDYGDFISDGNPEDSETDPKGFITVLIFDRNYNLVDAAWDQLSATYVQTGTKKMPHDLLSMEVLIKEPGFVYAYLSNEGVNQQNIYFDDLSITHTKSAIVAGADYYPYGMVMEGREITRQPYRFGYQGQYSEENEQTGWNEFDLRFYDAKIAKWLTSDPYGQYYSPYMAMGNIPNMGVDPDGGLFGLSPGWSALAGAGIGFGTGAGAALISGNSDKWLTWGGIGAGLGAIVGLATADRIEHGSKNARSITGGKKHDNRTFTKSKSLKYEKFVGYLEKEFYLEMGDEDLEGQTVTRRPLSFKFKRKYTKTLRFNIRGASNAIFAVEKNRKEIFTNKNRPFNRQTPTYHNNGETYTPVITYTYPTESERAEEVEINSIAPRVKITRKVKGLYLSRIHGSGWRIVN